MFVTGANDCNDARLLLAAALQDVTHTTTLGCRLPPRITYRRLEAELEKRVSLYHAGAGIVFRRPSIYLNYLNYC